MTPEDRDALAMDLSALATVLPALIGSGSTTTTISVHMLDRLYRAARPIDPDDLARAVLSARSTTGAWKGNARATEPTQWDRIMAKRIVASLAEAKS